MWGQVQSLCKARGVWWKKAAPIPGGLTVTAGLVPPRDSHCSVSVLSPLLVLPTPSSTGRLQTELQTQLPRTWPLRQAAAGSHPSTLELEAVFPAPRKFQHSQKYRSSKGRQVSLRSPSAQVTLSTPTKPCTSGRQGLPEAHCPQTQQGKEAPGALTGGYVGHHLGATVKDGTQQDSIPNAVVQSRKTLHVPHLPQAQLINTVQKC